MRPARIPLHRRIVPTRPVTTAPLGACNAKTLRCADARDYMKELRPCCRRHIVEIMGHTMEALNDVGATWWADYGTLMGAVCNPLTTWADYPWLPQEGRPAGPLAPGIIPHDKDGDLGVAWRDWAPVQRRLRGLAARGYHLHVNHHRHSIKVRLSARNHTNVDLFFWRERPTGMMYREHYARVDEFKGREFHRDLLFPLSTVPFEGMTLPAPRDPAAFLEMRYGADWRTPVAANNKGERRK